jgi:hypothetical protein
LEAVGRFERRQGKEIVRETVAPRQKAIDCAAIEVVAEPFLSGLKREIPPDDDPGWQKPSHKDVGAEVHMMVPVITPRLCAVKTAELVLLRRQYIPERSDKTRVKNNLCEPARPQKRGKSMLMFKEHGGHTRLGKWGRKIQMKPSIDSLFSGNPRRTLGVFHQHHCAHRRNGSAANAFQGAVSRLAVAAPVVGIDD